MQGDVHLDILDEGVRSLLHEVPDHRLVLVLAGPDEGGPAPIILYVYEVPGQLILTQDNMSTF